LRRNFSLLLSPPGWTLSIGGPHIALPLLKSFLESHNITVEIRDLNIACSKFYNIKLEETDVIKSCESLTLSSMNVPYFSAQAKLTSIAHSYRGSWDIQSGFSNDNFDAASSESVRLFSIEPSPHTEFFSTEVIPFIMNSQPAITGLSVVVPSQLLSSFELCRLLRAAGYRGKIVIGGNVVTRLGEALFLDWVFDLVDGIVSFQGEEALLGLFRVIEAGGTLEDVPNLTWKREGEIVSNKTKLLEVARFKQPDFSGLNLQDYWGVRYLPVIGSRGCYYGRCTFCAIPYGWGHNGFLGHGNPDAVFENMKIASRLYGLSRFKFVEEALHPSVLNQLIDLIDRERFECQFEGYARLDSFWCNTSFLQKASRAGLRKLYVGMELSQSETRGTLNKCDTASTVEMLLKLHEYGIRAHVFCLFGYPGTGTEEAYSTIEFVLKHRKLIDSLDIFPFHYAKHTKVDLIQPVINTQQDWALEYDYTSELDGVLCQEEVKELATQLEDLIWDENPTWLHPLYRMYSPWQESLRLSPYRV
jgi:anaerobic magnesium-protoporphyrin IX monomethyl ester cyclase